MVIPVRERREDAAARGQLPALTAIDDGHRFDDQVLNNELFVALEAGTYGHGRDFDVARLVDGELGAPGAATALPARPFGGWLRCLLHAARLDPGAAVQALQPRDLVTQLGVLCLQPGIVLQNLYEQRAQLFETKPVDDAG